RPVQFPGWDRNRLGDQGRQENTHAQESELRRHHHRVLEFLRRDLRSGGVDAVGNAELRQRPAHANHGHRSWCFAGALSKREGGRGLLGIDPIAKMLNRQRGEDVFRKVLKWSTADETEAMVGSTVYSLTRFANNTIHQNVAEEGSYLSVRAVVEQRTARATTNKFD